MNKETILEELIKDAEWSIRYHADKLVSEGKSLSPREWEMNYHRQKLEQQSVLLEKLKQ